MCVGKEGNGVSQWCLKQSHVRSECTDLILNYSRTSI